jgi:thiosulfate/3-mercaptopyruvate sulfurtransferase
MTRVQTVIDAETLAAHYDDPDWVVVDCRFKLGEPEFGRREWSAGTIPGARFANLDRDLAAPVRAGVTGRHPLPTPEDFAATLGGWRVGPLTQVVVFDQAGGAFAARLWWMLRWVGHTHVAVLDGGFPAWVAGGYPVAPGRPTSVGDSPYAITLDARVAVDAAAVLAASEDDAVTVLDARAESRYRGEGETTDPIAGHIPGAISAPFADNLDAEGRLRPAAELRARFEALLDGRRSRDAICYCGSGVTACHDILAMAHAGLEPARLYPGSWSEWIVDPTRPRS